MTSNTPRWANTSNAQIANGYTLERVTPASRLYGANGLRTGSDGRIYVAQVAGSQISALNIDTGDIDTISPMGGDIVGPDDLAFDDEGNIFATELTEDRVCVRDKKGNTRIVQGDMPCANPITMYRGRLIAGECRPGGRIMELPLDGSAPRVILDNAPMPNAFEVGPDGLLYFPAMATNEICRISLDGGEPEVVAKDLGVPDSVKFDKDGNIVSTQVASGQVLKIDPRTGDKTLLAQLTPGLDNCTFVDDRLFVSSITGEITEILGDGKTKSLINRGLQWPMGLAADNHGTLFIADGGFDYLLTQGSTPECVGMLFSPGFPGFTRGVVASGEGEWIVTTANGDVACFWPAESRSEVIANGFDRLMDVTITSNGSLVFAEYGTGKVHTCSSQANNGSESSQIASDLEMPSGVAVDSDDNIYVSERSGGRITRISSNGKVDTFVDGLKNPQGITVSGNTLYVIDTGSKELLAIDIGSAAQNTLASNLPVGTPAGITPKPLMGVGDLSGPMTDFTGLALGADGTLYISGDAEGSVLALRPNA